MATSRDVATPCEKVSFLVILVGAHLEPSLTLTSLSQSHAMKKSAAKRGVHYAPLRCIDISSNAVSVVEMVEEEARMTFRVTA